MSEMFCQKCYKSSEVLKALGQLRQPQGYAQCGYCLSDLEFESAVIMDIGYKREKEEGVPIPEWHFDHLLEQGLISAVNSSGNVVDTYDEYKDYVKANFAGSQNEKRAHLDLLKLALNTATRDIERLESELS